jgi:hypothetical protein
LHNNNNSNNRNNESFGRFVARNYKHSWMEFSLNFRIDSNLHSCGGQLYITSNFVTYWTISCSLLWLLYLPFYILGKDFGSMWPTTQHAMYTHHHKTRFPPKQYRILWTDYGTLTPPILAYTLAGPTVYQLCNGSTAKTRKQHLFLSLLCRVLCSIFGNDGTDLQSYKRTTSTNTNEPRTNAILITKTFLR